MAGAPTGTAGFQISFPVAGLTADNADVLAVTLEALTVTAWTCPDCKLTHAEPGPCDECGAECKERTASLVKEARADVAAGSITLVPSNQQPLTLSQVARAVEAKGARVDRGGMSVPAPAVLVVSGGTGDKDAEAVVKALSDAQLYERVRGGFDQETREIRVRVGGERRPPRYNSIIQALGSAPGTLRLADIAWAVPAKPAAAPEQGAGPTAKAGKGQKGAKGKGGKDKQTADGGDDGDGR